MLKYIKFSIFLFLIFVSYFPAFSQTEEFFPDSIDKINLWHISDSTNLFVGASFYYTDPEDSIIVWLYTSESDVPGELYFMIPGFSDSALFLFTNRDNGARVNITELLDNPIPPGTEIFFMYKREASDKNLRYTGQNRPGIDPEDQTNYPGASFVSKQFGLRPGFGHRWAVAGRIMENSGAPTDTIIFGFEDDALVIIPDSVTSDFDFNDVIFKTTGLDLNVDPFVDTLILSVEDTVTAGDSVYCIASVWADSAGKRIRSSRFDSLLNWELTGNSVHNDTLIHPASGSDSIALFLPQTAFRSFTINVSILDPLIKDTINISKQVYILPGAPSSLSIEHYGDTSSPIFNFNINPVIPSIQIFSNMNSVPVYAILRDSYGNFADFSQNAVWDTSSDADYPVRLNPSIASVENGNTEIGEAIITKHGTGNILVYASDTSSGETFTDTALVNIASTDYDSLRIRIIETSDTIYPSGLLIITTDSCKNMIAEGLRVDNHIWEQLAVNWSSNIKSNLPDDTVRSVKYCPGDTGTGFIRISYYDVFSILPLKVKPGKPVRLSIYTDQLTLFGQDTVLSAGNVITLKARLSDKNDILLPSPAPDTIRWSLIEEVQTDSTNSSGDLSDTLGSEIQFLPLRAYRTVKIIAGFGELCDTVRIKINPGNPYRVVIESHADWQKSMHSPDEIDTVEIPDNSTQATVYAIIRDSLGNFIDSLREGVWGNTDTLVKIESGTKISIGKIQKNLQVKEGVCKIFVSNESFSDTAFVKLLPYHFIDLRIVTVNYKVLDTLVISTNFDTILRAQGLRSDTALWRDITAEWALSQDLIINSGESFHSNLLYLSPIKPGTGTVSATSSSTNDTLRDSIFVEFLRGRPTHADITLITEPQKRIAGDTITAVVRVYNQDGLVPDLYCYEPDSSTGGSLYFDSLGHGNRNVKPEVITGLGSSVVNSFDTQQLADVSQCFLNGIDTVQFLIYFAPFISDSLHQLTVKLGDITASTSPFRMYPSDLDSLSIAHTNPCCPDTLIMRYPDNEVLLYALGYDRFKNMRGGETCIWHTTGTLHPFETKTAASRILYTADSINVKDDENGYAIAVFEDDETIIDSLYVKITGPLATPVSAITGDRNGNGLLDLIKIRFNMPVYNNHESLGQSFYVKHINTIFTTDSITFSKDSLTVNLFVREIDNGTLQTSWKPIVSLNNSDFMLGGAIDSFTIETHDGAGPVIASVIREIGDSRKDDLITVTFSEEVTDSNGNRFSLLALPQKTFNTWVSDKNNKFKQLSLLKDIPHFNAPYRTDQLFFNTSNEIEFTAEHYFSLRTDQSSNIVKDNAGNIPSEKNRKVQVVVRGKAPQKLVIVPNPTKASILREKPGEFHLEHNPSAIQWVKADKSGTVITFDILIPDSCKKIGGKITIFDQIGNTVISDPVKEYKWTNLFRKDRIASNTEIWNITPKEWNADGTVYKYCIYWNGYTAGKFKTAPGVYRVVLKMIYKINGKDTYKTYTGKIGIKQ